VQAYQVRQAYLRHLQVDDEPPLPTSAHDSRLYIALHHFHPEIVHSAYRAALHKQRSAAQSPLPLGRTRSESLHKPSARDDLFTHDGPMGKLRIVLPRILSHASAEALGILPDLTDQDQVVDAYGQPTNSYLVVPHYTAARVQKDLQALVHSRKNPSQSPDQPARRRPSSGQESATSTLASTPTVDRSNTKLPPHPTDAQPPPEEDDGIYIYIPTARVKPPPQDPPPAKPVRTKPLENAPTFDIPKNHRLLTRSTSIDAAQLADKFGQFQQQEVKMAASVAPIDSRVASQWVKSGTTTVKTEASVVPPVISTTAISTTTTAVATTTVASIAVAGTTTPTRLSQPLPMKRSLSVTDFKTSAPPSMSPVHLPHHNKPWLDDDDDDGGGRSTPRRRLFKSWSARRFVDNVLSRDHTSPAQTTPVTRDEPMEEADAATIDAIPHIGDITASSISVELQVDSPESATMVVEDKKTPVHSVKDDSSNRDESDQNSAKQAASSQMQGSLSHLGAHVNPFDDTSMHSQVYGSVADTFVSKESSLRRKPINPFDSTDDSSVEPDLIEPEPIEDEKMREVMELERMQQELDHKLAQIQQELDRKHAEMRETDIYTQDEQLPEEIGVFVQNGLPADECKVMKQEQQHMDVAEPSEPQQEDELHQVMETESVHHEEQQQQQDHQQHAQVYELQFEQSQHMDTELAMNSSHVLSPKVLIDMDELQEEIERSTRDLPTVSTPVITVSEDAKEKQENEATPSLSKFVPAPPVYAPSPLNLSLSSIGYAAVNPSNESDLPVTTTSTSSSVSPLQATIGEPDSAMEAHMSSSSIAPLSPVSSFSPKPAISPSPVTSPMPENIDPTLTPNSRAVALSSWRQRLENLRNKARRRDPSVEKAIVSNLEDDAMDTTTTTVDKEEDEKKEEEEDAGVAQGQGGNENATNVTDEREAQDTSREGVQNDEAVEADSEATLEAVTAALSEEHLSKQIMKESTSVEVMDASVRSMTATNPFDYDPTESTPVGSMHSRTQVSDLGASITNPFDDVVVNDDDDDGGVGVGVGAVEVASVPATSKFIDSVIESDSSISNHAIITKDDDSLAKSVPTMHSREKEIAEELAGSLHKSKNDSFSSISMSHSLHAKPINPFDIDDQPETAIVSNVAMMQSPRVAPINPFDTDDEEQADSSPKVAAIAQSATISTSPRALSSVAMMHSSSKVLSPASTNPFDDPVVVDSVTAAASLPPAPFEFGSIDNNNSSNNIINNTSALPTKHTSRANSADTGSLSSTAPLISKSVSSMTSSQKRRSGSHVNSNNISSSTNDNNAAKEPDNGPVDVDEWTEMFLTTLRKAGIKAAKADFMKDDSDHSSSDNDDDAASDTKKEAEDSYHTESLESSLAGPLTVERDTTFDDDVSFLRPLQALREAPQCRTEGMAVWSAIESKRRCWFMEELETMQEEWKLYKEMLQDIISTTDHIELLMRSSYESIEMYAMTVYPVVTDTMKAGRRLPTYVKSSRSSQSDKLRQRRLRSHW
jgi:hypothetical protein